MLNIEVKETMEIIKLYSPNTDVPKSFEIKTLETNAENAPNNL